MVRLIAQDLDKTAFSALFDETAPRIKASFLKMGMDSSGAEDLLQDVMINVWTKAGLFDPARGTVFGWIFTIARNARIDRWRRDKPTTPLDLLDWNPADESENSEDRLVRLDEASALQAALVGISAEQKQILEFSYIEGLTQIEIAKRLQLPLGTVKSRMRLAYTHLRKALEKV